MGSICRSVLKSVAGYLIIWAAEFIHLCPTLDLRSIPKGSVILFYFIIRKGFYSFADW